MLEHLKQAVLDEWRQEPATVNLVKMLTLRLGALTGELEKRAANGTDAGVIYAIGGRVNEARGLLEIITTTKGREDE